MKVWPRRKPIPEYEPVSIMDARLPVELIHGEESLEQLALIRLFMEKINGDLGRLERDVKQNFRMLEGIISQLSALIARRKPDD